MKKVLAIATVALVLALWGRIRTGRSGGEPAETRRTPVFVSREPLAIRTCRGELLTLEAPPQRILPANAGLVDALALLIGPERVRALPAIARDYSRFDHGVAPEAAWQHLPTFVDYRAEVVLGLDPDLVLASPWQSPDATGLLRREGIPVLLLPVPRTWQEALDGLTFLGRLLDVEERAGAVRADLEERARRLAAGPVAALGLRALSYTNFGSGGTTAGRGTTVNILLGLAGLRNAAGEAGIEGYGNLPDERLLAIDPDLILVSAGDGREDSASLRFLRSSRILAGLPALREERILTLPSALAASTSVRLLDAAEAIASTLESRLPLR